MTDDPDRVDPFYVGIVRQVLRAIGAEKLRRLIDRLEKEGR